MLLSCKQHTAPLNLRLRCGKAGGEEDTGLFFEIDIRDQVKCFVLSPLWDPDHTNTDAKHKDEDQGSQLLQVCRHCGLVKNSDMTEELKQRQEKIWRRNAEREEVGKGDPQLGACWHMVQCAYAWKPSLPALALQSRMV